MGCCVSRSNASDSDDMENTITIGKNRPLIQERIKWKSDVPMTDGQLRSKRDEFWETAPAFEGRKEIWDALRAASALAEQGDYALSQAILDGANISLPDGTLRESYDELGNRYQVPYYCLSAPTNLVEERSESSIGTLNAETGRAGGSSSHVGGGGGSALGDPQTLKLRLSTTGEDVSVDCYSRETIHIIKQRLHQTVDTIPPANQQRWLFSGRILLDKMRIGDCKIPQNFVVQVVIHSSSPTTNVVAKGGSETNQQQTDQTQQEQQQHGSSSSANNGGGDTSALVVLHKESPQSAAAHGGHSPKKQQHGTTDEGHPLSSAASKKSAIRQSPVASIATAKEPSLGPELPGSTGYQTSVDGNENSAAGGGDHRQITTTTGSSSSRKSTGKLHNRHHRGGGGKLRAGKSLSYGNSSATTTTIVQQPPHQHKQEQRCNSLTAPSSKRNADSPTPVETA